MKLSLAEGLMLIGLDDTEGRLLSIAEHTIDQGLVLIIILELSLSKRIELRDGNLTVKNNLGTGNKVHDEVLKALGEKTLSINKAVKLVVSKLTKIQDEIAELLVHRGILKIESTKLLWVPVSDRMDNANYAFEQEIRDTLIAIVLKGKKPSVPFAILLVLISYCELLEEIFTNKDDLIDAIKVAKDLLQSDHIDLEIRNTLQLLKPDFDANHHV